MGSGVTIIGPGATTTGSGAAMTGSGVTISGPGTRTGSGWLGRGSTRGRALCRLTMLTTAAGSRGAATGRSLARGVITGSALWPASFPTLRLVARAATGPFIAMTLSAADGISLTGISLRGAAAGAGALRRRRRTDSKYTAGPPSTSRKRNSTTSTSGKPSCLILRWNASGIRSTTKSSRGGRPSDTTQVG